MKKDRTLSIQLLIVIAILVMLNLLLSSYFFRWDLTKEKRYSLSSLSRTTARAIEYPLFATVYLEGEYAPVVRNFQEGIRTNLLEIKQYAGGNLEYEFVDPANNRELIQSFQERGIVPIPYRERLSATEVKSKVMWPIIRFTYRNRELYLDVLKGCRFPNGEVDFQKAEANIEYNLISAIRNLTAERAKTVAMLQGHGELNPTLIPNDLGQEILNSYNFGIWDMSVDSIAGMGIPGIDVILVIQPTQAFSERDKYELDQYLMRGGSIMWVLDLQKVDMDMYEKRSTLTSLYDLNLDDMLSSGHYGFKINADLIQDLNSERTEVFQEGPSGGTFSSERWIYYPLIYEFPDHPISRNVEFSLLRYAGSIDTFYRRGITNSVFMQSSPQSRSLTGTLAIDLNQVIAETPPPSVFVGKGNRITGLTVEGMFESLFVGRENSSILLNEKASAPPTAQFLIRNTPGATGKMAVISDGEFVQSKLFRGKRGPYLPGDNKTIFMNTLDYLAGDAALTQIRAKEVVVRRLDKEKVQEYTSFIRFINLALPIIVVLLFGLIRSFLRKKRNVKLNSQ